MNKWIVELYVEEATDEKYYRMAFEQRGYVIKPVSIDNVLICDAVLLFNSDNTRSIYHDILTMCEQRDIPILVVGGTEGIQHGIDVREVSFEGLQERLLGEDEHHSNPIINRLVRGLVLALTCLSILFGTYVVYRLSPHVTTETIVKDTGERMMDRYGNPVAQVWSISIIGDSVFRGSGFLVGERYLVTNAHVVDHPSSMYRLVFDKKTVNANVVALDASNDIALLRLDEDIGIEPLFFTKEEPARDSEIYAIGFPESDGKTLVSGVYEGTRIPGNKGVIYSVAFIALRKGNSGSPVLDNKGNVIGIASAVSALDADIGLIVPYDICLNYLKDYMFLP